MARPERASTTRPVFDPAAGIEVVYALPDRQDVVTMALPPEGLTALEACERSGLLDVHAELRTRPLVLGIFGKVCAPEHPLRSGDRVEIYRPLKINPRESRRGRAAQTASRGKRR